VLLRKTLRQCDASVRRAVADDDHVQRVRRVILRQQVGQPRRQFRGAVADRQDHADPGNGRRRRARPSRAPQRSAGHHHRRVAEVRPEQRSTAQPEKEFHDTSRGGHRTVIPSCFRCNPYAIHAWYRACPYTPPQPAETALFRGILRHTLPGTAGTDVALPQQQSAPCYGNAVGRVVSENTRAVTTGRGCPRRVEAAPAGPRGRGPVRRQPQAGAGG
jgi:hypothetical protein